MNVVDIKDPSFLKTLNIDELEALAGDIRTFLIQNVSKTGGHFSSNLGVVELTIALHYVFESPKDYILFDVGHQSYVHKILTGRAKDFDTLRQFNGLSGFMKTYESEHDHWEAGHSSTAISGAVGMAVARDLDDEDYEIIAVVGDAAFMSGESLEALNHLGGLNSKVIIILNDNDMSIGRNVGGLSNYFNNIRKSVKYNNMRDNYVNALTKNKAGNALYKFTRSIKDRIKRNVLSESMFSEFGIDYVGPIDGHNFEELITGFEMAKRMNHSVVIHVHTIKGKGYPLAEYDKQGLYHGVAPFDYTKGIVVEKDPLNKSFSQLVSDQIDYLMDRDEDIVCVTPAMITGSCLRECFNHHPDRCFDVGIAEEHAMTFVAGLSMNKKKPYLTIYSSFLQRAYDQLNHDIARMDIPCLIGIDRAGLVGEDGDTHHGVFDIGLFSSLPHIIFMTPKDSIEAIRMINTAMFNNDHPYLIRFPKGNVETVNEPLLETIEIGSWEWIIDKKSTITIITYDTKVGKVERMINEYDLPISLVNARFLKPMDYNMLNMIGKSHQKILVYETDMINGGLGSMISQYYHENHINVDLYFMGIEDHYVPQGTIDELLDYEKIDIKHLYLKIKELLDEKGKS